MPWLIGAVVGFLVLVAIVAFIGSRLPREHVATVKVRFGAAPQAVWAVLSDPYSASTWRKDVKKVERVADINGHPAWREESGFGVITYELTESIEPVSRTTRIVEDNLPYGGQWEYRLSQVADGSELLVTERGFVKPALFRFMSRYIFGYTGTMIVILKQLGAKLGERVTPEVVASGKD